MSSLISSFKLTPEQIANYKPGMDLGKPDRVYQPESLIQKPAKSPLMHTEATQAAIKKPNSKKKFFLSKEEYLQLRLSGVSRKEIAVQNKMTLESMIKCLRVWGLSAKGAEDAALGKPVADISEKQIRVLDCIEILTEQYRQPPSLKELADALQLRGNAVRIHLKKLKDLGYIQWILRESRSIKILKQVEVRE